MRLLHSLRRHLWLMHTAPERCCVKNEGEIISSISSIVHAYFLCFYLWGWLRYACGYMCPPLYSFDCCVWVFRCGSRARKCVGSSGNKRSLHRFEEPNQMLANFSRLLCSSEAIAGLLFCRPPSSCSHLPTCPITAGGWGALLSTGLCVDVLHSCGTRRNLLPRRSVSSWINTAPAEAETVCISYFPNVGMWTQVTCSSLWLRSSKSLGCSQRQGEEGSDTNGYILS